MTVIRPGTPPDRLSSRISWWPEDKAPESVKTVCDHIWTDRDRRVTWWFGCCGVAENPDGFPMFLKSIKTARVGHYWFGLAFERPGTRYQVTDIRDRGYGTFEASESHAQTAKAS